MNFSVLILQVTSSLMPGLLLLRHFVVAFSSLMGIFSEPYSGGFIVLFLNRFVSVFKMQY